MECKNCKTTLKETAKFCDECGGKIINHRLNFKTVTAEFFATFISWDNKFFKTFSHLITKPQEVANGYLDGVRKRYMQPFAYMIIILSIYGIYIILSKEIIMEYLDTIKESMTKFSAPNPSKKVEELNNNFNTKMLNFMINYSNIYTLASIPVFAFINKLIFKKRNFIEHNVALLYAYGSFLLLSSVIGFTGLIFHINYGTTYNILMPLMIIYHMYFYKKIFQLDIATTILKTLYFWLLLIIFFIFIVILIVLGLMLAYF